MGKLQIKNFYQTFKPVATLVSNWYVRWRTDDGLKKSINGEDVDFNNGKLVSVVFDK